MDNRHLRTGTPAAFWLAEMKRVIPLLIVAAAAALAQTPNDVLAELNQTDQVIERVTPLVEQSGNVEAQMLLAEAKRVQAQAWNAYHGRRYRFALGQTRYARRKARDAAALVEISPERIREEIRLTAELMERVRAMMSRGEDARATELWNMAQTEQATARQAYEAREYRRALKFTFAARMHLREIAGLLGRYMNPDRIEAELGKTRRLLERTAAAIRTAANQRAHELLRKAEDLQARATTSFDSRRLREALKLTLTARELVFRALELGLGKADLTVVEQALAATQDLLDDWAAQITAADSPEAISLLNQARTMQQTAREQLAAGDNGAALGSTTRARRLLQRAIAVIQSGETTSPSQH